MDGRELESFQPYEDSVTSKVQGKLLQYYDKMKDGQRQSDQDKQNIQELVSDISHQVKTPIANIQMFTGILQKHQLSDEKRTEFLITMAEQINKLDFLMQSLIKMSRLETGTFVIHMEEGSLSDTIAQAVSGIWAKAEQKAYKLKWSVTARSLGKNRSKPLQRFKGRLFTNTHLMWRKARERT